MWRIICCLLYCGYIIIFSFYIRCYTKYFLLAYFSWKTIPRILAFRTCSTQINQSMPCDTDKFWANLCVLLLMVYICSLVAVLLQAPPLLFVLPWISWCSPHAMVRLRPRLSHVSALLPPLQYVLQLCKLCVSLSALFIIKALSHLTSHKQEHWDSASPYPCNCRSFSCRPLLFK